MALHTANAFTTQVWLRPIQRLAEKQAVRCGFIHSHQLSSPSRYAGTLGCHGANQDRLITVLCPSLFFINAHMLMLMELNVSWFQVKNVS